MGQFIEVEIGSHNWATAVRDFTNSFDRDYWDNFTPWKPTDFTECESAVHRTLPDDFKRFVLEFGSGDFGGKYLGCIYTAAEIVDATPGPMWMTVGSSEWASDDDHRKIYATRGEFNPLSEHVAPAEFIQDGVSLFDLLQIGTDGYSCYHQINVSEQVENRPFGYCLLASDPSFEHQLPSFSAGLSLILSFHRAMAVGDEEIIDFRAYGKLGGDSECE